MTVNDQQILDKKAKSAAWHKQWRDKNPEKQQAIMERFWLKKAAKFSADLVKIQAELE